MLSSRRVNWPSLPNVFRNRHALREAVGEPYAEDASLLRKRYVVERTLSWLKAFRRLRYIVERTAKSFHALVYLAVLVLCVRRLLSPSRGGAPAR